MNYSIKYLFINWLIIISSIVLTIRFHLIYPITFLVIANRQFANYLVGHDGIHGLITRNKVLNDFLGRFLCLNPVFVSFESYQVNHMAHHEFLGTQVDPDKALFNFYPINFKKYIYGLFVYFISFKLLNDFISYFTPFRLMLKSRNWKNFFNFDVISFVLFHVLLFFLVNRFHVCHRIRIRVPFMSRSEFNKAKLYRYPYF